jgi:hypothetical protein
MQNTYSRCDSTGAGNRLKTGHALTAKNLSFYAAFSKQVATRYTGRTI